METQTGQQASNDDVDNAFVLVCIIATFNKIISNSIVKEDLETIKVNKSSFFNALNDIAEKYYKNFRIVEPRPFDPSQSIALIMTKFSDFVEVSDDDIVIDPSLENFQETFSRLAFSIASDYIQKLIYHAEKLGHEYRQLDKGEKMEASEQKEDNVQNNVIESTDDLKARDISTDKATAFRESEGKHDNITEQKEDRNESQPVDESNPNLITEEPAHPEHDVSVPESIDEDQSASKKTRSSSQVMDHQQHKRFQNIAVNLISNIESHRFSSPFLQPVNIKEEEDYLDVVYEPKDLKSILKAIKLKNDPPEYFLMQDLKRDIMLMLANCIMYNKSDSDLVELTRIMKNDILNTFKVFEDAES